jgi:hypothetical protein
MEAEVLLIVFNGTKSWCHSSNNHFLNPKKTIESKKFDLLFPLFLFKRWFLMKMDAKHLKMKAR